MGEEVLKFEEMFAEKVGSRFAVMTNSGSSANLAMLTASKYVKNSNLNDGDAVIVPAVSWSTTYYPIHQQGFSLSLVDIDRETLNIDVEKVLEAITERTKAIFAVNLLGNPSNLIELRDIASEYNLLLLEDNCESLGATLEEKQTGTFGLAGTYSSFFSHHISTMEGGITVTDDEALYQTMKSVRAHGWTRDLPEENHVHDKSGDEWEDLFRFVIPGYNLRPLELEGAVGQSQISKLDSFIQVRRSNAKYLLGISQNLKYIKFQRENGKSSWFGFSILLTGPLTGKRHFLIQKLNEADIQSRPVVAGNFAKNPVMRRLRHEPIPLLKNADDIHLNALFVGNHHYPIETQLERLVTLLSEFEDQYV
jgi:CDP-6-deoxy-D-xylo-4-hexulose-3-dehydrase